MLVCARLLVTLAFADKRKNKQYTHTHTHTHKERKKNGGEGRIKYELPDTDCMDTLVFAFAFRTASSAFASRVLGACSFSEDSPLRFAGASSSLDDSPLGASSSLDESPGFAGASSSSDDLPLSPGVTSVVVR